MNGNVKPNTPATGEKGAIPGIDSPVIAARKERLCAYFKGLSREIPNHANLETKEGGKAYE